MSVNNRHLGTFAARVLMGLLVGWASNARLRAQDSDTAVFKDGRRGSVILSEIEDVRERQAFLEAYSEKDPANRHKLAAAFLDTYPKSWLLAKVLDLEAKSSIDLGEYQRALQEAAFSLRLMPENAILLVLVANVQSRLALFDEAQANAKDALLYLDQFARAGDFTEERWRAIKTQLKASAYFALGRALATRGLREPSAGRNILAQALDALNHSAAWNPEDPETIYLRALVEVSLSQNEPAIRDLAYVARMSNALSPDALARFRHLSNKDPLRMSNPVTDVSLREKPVRLMPPEVLRGGYAGSAACRECHRQEYETWRQTGMARMFQPYKPENIIGDFFPRLGVQGQER